MPEVGRYIVDHPQQAVNLSTGEFAHGSGVSEAAVVRVSQRLGYRGYCDLQLNLAYDLGEEASVEPEAIVGDDDMSALAAKTLAVNIQSLTDSHRMLDADALEHAVQIIAKARRVAVLSEGANFGTAADLHYDLTKQGVNSVFLADPYRQMATVRHRSGGCVDRHLILGKPRSDRGDQCRQATQRSHHFPDLPNGVRRQSACRCSPLYGYRDIVSEGERPPE